MAKIKDVQKSFGQIIKAYRVTIEPNTTHEGVEYRHEGEKFSHALKGRFSITVGKNTSALERGESLHFNSALHHTLNNPPAKKRNCWWFYMFPDGGTYGF